MYDARSIKILDGVELAEIPYMKINAVAQKYHKNRDIVESAYQACMIVGLDFDSFYIAKYCKGEDIPKSSEFIEAYKECRKPYLDKARTSK